MAEAVYILCSLTSLTCWFLLLRGYRRTRLRFLFWSALCFMFLAVSNILVFVDLIVVPNTDLAWLRSLISLAGMSALVFGLVWETR